MSKAVIEKARSGVAAGKLGGKGHAAQPSVVCSNPTRDERYLSAWTRAVLESLMARAGVQRIYITSTYRSPHDQARVMLDILKPGKSMYGGHGQRVEQVARNIVLLDQVGTILSDAIAKLPGVKPTHYQPHSRDAIIDRMAQAIDQLEKHHGEGCVSRHQVDPGRLNVVDIASNAVVPAKARDRFIEVLTASTRIERIGLPKGSALTHSKQFIETQNCIHLEIPQPLDVPGGTGTQAVA